MCQDRGGGGGGGGYHLTAANTLSDFGRLNQFGGGGGGGGAVCYKCHCYLEMVLITTSQFQQRAAKPPTRIHLALRMRSSHNNLSKQPPPAPLH